jgi:hypothetical protein
MPRNFFILKWPDRLHEDNEGTLLPNDATACLLAERVIRELKKAGGYEDPMLLMLVKDERGRQVATIPFAEKHSLH